MNNHEKHYILWDGIVKKMEYFKDMLGSGIFYINGGTILKIRNEIIKNHPNLDSLIRCYACEEANRIGYKKKYNKGICFYCPINWGYDMEGVKIRTCVSPGSIYRAVFERCCIDDAILLATKIRDAEWRDRDAI